LPRTGLCSIDVAIASHFARDQLNRFDQPEQVTDPKVYRTTFSALREALRQFDANDGATRVPLAAALDAAGELIRAGMLRTRAEARMTGSLRPGRRYLDSADAETVREAARVLNVPAPLLVAGDSDQNQPPPSA
jgi:hypothetical protein